MKPQLFVLLLFAMHAKAGEMDTIPAQPLALQQAYRPVFRLTDKDLAHLPFTNIMEALNGRFPFVFLDPPSVLDYNFMVDGSILLNPDAINVSQIALIEFYPVAFNLGNGGLSRKGTFVITTKSNMADSRTGWDFRSQAGVVFPTDRSFPVMLPGAPEIRRTKEFFTHQEAGYAHRSEKLSVNSALAYTRNPGPGYHSSRINTTQEYNHKWQRIRFSNFATYNVSGRLKLRGSVLLNSQAARAEEDARNQNGDIFDEADIKNNMFYSAARAAIDYSVSRNIANTLQFEYAYGRHKTDLEGTYYIQSPGEDQLRSLDAKTSVRRFAVTNDLNGTITTGRQLSVGWQLLLRYDESKSKANNTYIVKTRSGSQMAISAGTFFQNARSVAVMPRLSAAIADQLLITAGLTYDSWKYTPYPPVRSKDKLMPYAGIRWSMPRANNTLSSLHIHSTYGKQMQRSTESDMLDVYPTQRLNFSFGYYTPYGMAPPGETWITAADMGFMKDRLLLSVSYMRGNGHPYITVAVPMGGGTSMPVNITREGVSVDVQAVLANREAFSCKLRAILFYERDKVKNDPGFFVLDNGFAPNDMHPMQWRGSVEANITSGKMFFRANALLRFNEATRDFAGWETFDSHGLTFVTLGYAITNKMQLAAQAKNLIAMKEPVSHTYYGAKYLGLSLVWHL